MRVRVSVSVRGGGEEGGRASGTRSARARARRVALSSIRCALTAWKLPMHICRSGSAPVGAGPPSTVSTWLGLGLAEGWDEGWG